MPCLCGAGGSQTKDFTQAANMNNFQTLIEYCYNQVLQYDENWPPGVTQVDYGFKVLYKGKRP